MYVCKYACMCVCVYACECVWECKCVYVCVCVYVRMCVCVCMCVVAYVCICAVVCVCVYLCVCVYVRMCVYVCACMNARVCLYACMYKYRTLTGYCGLQQLFRQIQALSRFGHRPGLGWRATAPRGTKGRGPLGGYQIPGTFPCHLEVHHRQAKQAVRQLGEVG